MFIFNKVIVIIKVMKKREKRETDKEVANLILKIIFMFFIINQAKMELRF